MHTKLDSHIPSQVLHPEKPITHLRPTNSNKSPVANDQSHAPKYDRNFLKLRRDNPSLHLNTPRSTFHLSASTAPIDQLSHDLEQLSAELLFVSETDLPYKTFRHSFHAEELNATTFRDAMQIPATTKIRIDSIDEFFELYQDTERYAANALEAQKYTALENAMRTHLTQVQVIYVGGEEIVEGDVYIVGLDESGQLRGLKTGRVWT